MEYGRNENELVLSTVEDKKWSTVGVIAVDPRATLAKYRFV